MVGTLRFAHPTAPMRNPNSIFKQPNTFSRRRLARVLQEFLHAFNEEGAGNAGCSMHPQPRMQNKTKHTSIFTTGSPETNRHSLRDGVNSSSAVALVYRAC